MNKKMNKRPRINILQVSVCFFSLLIIFIHTSYAEWEEIESDLKTKVGLFYKLQFSSPYIGWVQAEKQVFKSENGGKNWFLLPVPCTSQDPRNHAISFADEYNGWIINGDTLYHTTDGGTTWTPIMQTIHGFRNISFQTAKKGVACTDTGIYFTTDAGITWEASERGRSFRILDIHFIDTLSGWIAGLGPGFDAGSVIRTKDGGKSWEQFWSPSYMFQSVWAIDSEHIVAAGISSLCRCGVIKVTFDGGITQQNMTFDTDVIIDIAFLDSQVGVAVPYTDSLFLQTFDGGKTWWKINEIRASGSLCVTVQSNALYVLIPDGRIFKYSKPTSTAFHRRCYPSISPFTIARKDIFFTVYSQYNMNKWLGISLLGRHLPIGQRQTNGLIIKKNNCP